MEKDQNLTEKPLWGSLSIVTDFVLLNLLWILCSLPILTIGASTSALYYCMLKIVREREHGIFSMFFHAYRDNLKQGCGLTMILAGIGIFLACDLWFFSLLEGFLFKIAAGIVMILVIVWLLVISYVFPILAQFENTVAGHLRSALILAITHPLKTISIVALNLLPVAFFLFAPSVFVASIPVWLFCGISMVAFFNAKILVKVFEQFIGSDDSKEGRDVK